MKRDINRFDTNDYPVDNVYGMSFTNKNVPDQMKDEKNSAIITEFVGLRAKMYVDGKDTKKIKSVKSNVCSTNYNDYTRCLFDEIEMTKAIV